MKTGEKFDDESNQDTIDKSTQSRKWLLTINNPLDHDCSHEQIKNILETITSITFWCLCDEIGEQGTPHTHVYIACSSGIRFSTLKKKFPSARLDFSKGTSQQCKDYIRKEGKYLTSKKKETNLIETYEEFGELPVERPGQRNDIHDLFDMIVSGSSDYDIINSNPDYMKDLDKIEKVRNILRQESQKQNFRKLDVTYIYGSPDSGKTRSVMELEGFEKVYRVTDNKHPWDSYKGQDIILFDEFYSSNYKISDMLNYLDGYPLELPCRYSNKVACYTKVFIISNISLDQQYLRVQTIYPQTYKALLRRINRIINQDVIGDIPHEWNEVAK